MSDIIEGEVVHVSHEKTSFRQGIINGLRETLKGLDAGEDEALNQLRELVTRREELQGYVSNAIAQRREVIELLAELGEDADV